MSTLTVMETMPAEGPQAGNGAERIVELLLEIHDAHVVGLEARHGAGKHSALVAADERLTELAALLLPAVAYVMGEDYDQLDEDDEVDCPCRERHPCECAPRSAKRERKVVPVAAPRPPSPSSQTRRPLSPPAVEPLPFSLQQQET